MTILASAVDTGSVEFRTNAAQMKALAPQPRVGERRACIEGLGSQGSIPARISRATEIVLIDLPLRLHFALAAERQARWHHEDARPAKWSVHY